MKYEYTREHMLPVMVELTYEDLQLIQKIAKYFIELETMPEGFWKGDIRKLEREVGEVMERVANATSYAFPKTTE